MPITAEELKADMEKYLFLARKEDILISYRGEIVARLSSPYPERTVRERVAIADSLIGIIPADITVEEAREERLDRIWGRSLTRAS